MLDSALPAKYIALVPTGGRPWTTRVPCDPAEVCLTSGSAAEGGGRRVDKLPLDDPRWKELNHRNWSHGKRSDRTPDAPFVPDELSELTSQTWIGQRIKCSPRPSSRPCRRKARGTTS